MRPFLAENGTLAADTTTTTANFDWIVARALLGCYRMLGDQAPGSETKEWQRLYSGAAREARRLNRRWDPTAVPRAIRVTV